MSSEYRPGGPLQSTPEHPLNVIPGGFHCSDLRLKNAQANAGVQAVVDKQVAQIVKWVAEWPKQQMIWAVYLCIYKDMINDTFMIPHTDQL